MQQVLAAAVFARFSQSRLAVANVVAILFALVATPSATAARSTRSEAAMAVAGRPCMGTFDHKASVVTLQQSPTAGIPWLIKLTPANAAFGEVNMSAQIYVDNNRANVYDPHIEPWNYQFHGPLPRTFQRFGGGTYTMHTGSEVSFLWTWNSVAQPAQGGYGFVNCVYSG